MLEFKMQFDPFHVTLEPNAAVLTKRSIKCCNAKIKTRAHVKIVCARQGRNTALLRRAGGRRRRRRTMAEDRSMEDSPGLPAHMRRPLLPKYLQEGELSPELKDLLPSLPTEQGWLAARLHRYQGFWYPTRHLSAVLSFQNHFVPLPTDVLLATAPKSGTTWLKATLFALLRRSLHPPGRPLHPLLAASPHDLVPFLELELYIDGKLPDFSSSSSGGGGSPRLFATHLPAASLPRPRDGGSRCKLVYLCRNPKDAFVSLWHFTNRLKAPSMASNPLEEAFDKFCRGVSINGPFWDHVLGYWKESLERPSEVLFLKYEDMKAQPGACLRRLAAFLGCPFSPEEEAAGVTGDIQRLCSFDNLSSLAVNRSGRLSSGEENKAFFRRGVVGDWKNHLTPEMIHRLDRITEEKWAGSGLRF